MHRQSSTVDLTKLKFDPDSVKHYPYRTATIGQHFAKLDRDEAYGLEMRLIKAAGVSRDNHVVFEITTTDGETIYLWFHDLSVFFGREIFVQPC